VTTTLATTPLPPNNFHFQLNIPTTMQNSHMFSQSSPSNQTPCQKTWQFHPTTPESKVMTDTTVISSTVAASEKKEDKLAGVWKWKNEHGIKKKKLSKKESWTSLSKHHIRLLSNMSPEPSSSTTSYSHVTTTQANMPHVKVDFSHPVTVVNDKWLPHCTVFSNPTPIRVAPPQESIPYKQQQPDVSSPAHSTFKPATDHKLAIVETHDRNVKCGRTSIKISELLN